VLYVQFKLKNCQNIESELDPNNNVNNRIRFRTALREVQSRRPAMMDSQR
jgi:hypothetical protein